MSWYIQEGAYPVLDGVAAAKPFSLSEPYPTWIWKIVKNGESVQSEDYPVLIVKEPPAWIEPIISRSSADVRYAHELLRAWKQGKQEIPETVPMLIGCLNYTDLNRIENNSACLAYYLQKKGVNISITTKTGWVKNEIPHLSDKERILQTMRDLVTAYDSLAYAAMPDLPEDLATYLHFNSIENVQLAMKNILESDAPPYRYIFPDANGDGVLDSEDAALIMSFSAAAGAGEYGNSAEGWNAFTAANGLPESVYPDANGDGAADAVDASLILAFSAEVGAGNYENTAKGFSLFMINEMGG